jgi:trk system potassium uptake protein TrkH
MAEFLRKLTAVMFYASIPMLVPIAYSLLVGDGAWMPITLTMLLLSFPAVPHLLRAVIKDMAGFARSVLMPDTPFNYSIIMNIKNMRREVESLTLGQILTLTSVAWILVPTISTIPYVYYGVPLLDAFFESMSGWTSTGLSSLPTLSTMPSSMILFRSITQWVGGLGIVVLILAVVRGKEAMKFLKAEGRAMTEVGIGETVGIIFKTYLFLTILGIFLLMFLGIEMFQAVNLTFAGISNGGFFPFDNFEFTDIQKFALAILMFAGATSFIFYRNVWEGLAKKSIFEEEFLLYVFITIAAILLITYVGGEDFYNTVLNTISALACGGFAIGDLAVLHDFPLYLLILLMLSGGMVGSTTGGIKLWRILVIAKSITNQIRKAFLPSGSVQVVKINGSAIDERMIVESATYVFTYLALFLFASGAFIIADYEFEDSLFMVASALGNVGLSTVSVPDVGELGKAFLILLMYLGRIEIFPSLALISHLMRR